MRRTLLLASLTALLACAARAQETGTRPNSPDAQSGHFGPASNAQEPDYGSDSPNETGRPPPPPANGDFGGGQNNDGKNVPPPPSSDENDMNGDLQGGFQVPDSVPVDGESE